MKTFGRLLSVIMAVAIICSTCMTYGTSAAISALTNMHVDVKNAPMIDKLDELGNPILDELGNKIQEKDPNGEVTLTTIKPYLKSSINYLFLPSSLDLTNLVLDYTVTDGYSGTLTGDTNFANNVSDVKIPAVPGEGADITSLFTSEPENGIYYVVYTFNGGIQNRYAIVQTRAKRTLYVNIDETQGTISAMNSDPNHETYCYGNNTYTENTKGEMIDHGLFEIRGRGNASWNLPKKGYQLKLNEKSKMFGMSSNKKWVLLANNDDHTLLRNALGFDMADELDLEGTPDYENCQVYFNGTYKGFYTICEKIEAKDSRVEVTDLEGTVDNTISAYNTAFGTEYTTLNDLVNAGAVTFNTDYSVANVKYNTQGAYVSSEFKPADILTDSAIQELVETEINKLNTDCSTSYPTDVESMPSTVEQIMTDGYAVYSNTKKTKVTFSYNGSVDVDFDIDMTGGYIVEYDWYYTKETLSFTISGNIGCSIVYPENLGVSINDVGYKYIKNCITKSYWAVRNKDGMNAGVSYTDMIDVDSFAKMWITKEYCMDWDACRSLYVYKDADSSENGGKLKAGPVWDFDNALGRNTSIYNGEAGYNNFHVTVTGGTDSWGGTKQDSLIASLSAHKEFMQIVGQQFDEYGYYFNNEVQKDQVTGEDLPNFAARYEELLAENYSAIYNDKILTGWSGAVKNESEKLRKFINLRNTYISNYIRNIYTGFTISQTEISKINPFEMISRQKTDDAVVLSVYHDSFKYMVVNPIANLEYTIDAADVGDYMVSLNYGVNADGASINMFMDNEQFAALKLDNTSSYNKIKTTEDVKFSLDTAGTHTLKIMTNGASVSLESMEVNKYCEHDYQESAYTAPTCLKTGLKTYTCTKCSKSYTEVIEALGHRYDCVVTPATCTANGVKTYTCVDGDDSYTEIIYSTGHDFVSEAVADGTKYTCNVCGFTYVDKGEGIDFTYAVTGMGTAAIRSYNGTATNVVIPEVINGFTITEIKSNAFKDNDIVSLTIPKSVSKLCKQAVNNCPLLENVYYYAENASYETFNLDGDGDGWTDLLENAILDLNEYLDLNEDVYSEPAISETVSNGNESVFFNCPELQNVTFENGVRAVPKNLFNDCEGLKTVNCAISLCSFADTSLPNTDFTIFAVSAAYAISYAKENRIKTTEWLIGDANGDGQVNLFDAALTARYAAGWDGLEVNNLKMEYNIDGVVDSLDTVIISRRLAGWKDYSMPRIK